MLDAKPVRVSRLATAEPSEQALSVAAAEGASNARLTLGPRTDGLPYRPSDRTALEKTLQSFLAALEGP